MEPTAFGAGLAGSQSDIVAFISKPLSILRFLNIFFSIIVFGCIISGGYEYDYCLYNGDTNACGYGVGIGVIAFVGSIVFLIVDLMMERLSNISQRRNLVIADMGFSGLWTFLWFVGFCYLTNKWTNTSKAALVLLATPYWKFGNVQAAIAFSFFSILSWAGTTYFATRQYLDGVEGLFASADEVSAQQQVPGTTAGQPPSTLEKGPLPPYQQQPANQYQEQLY